MPDRVGDHLAYCGAPPAPADLWARWNLDPILIAVLLAGLGLYLIQRGRSPRERLAFTAGWALTTLALISPLCALSVSLFSARVGQHMILTLVAAPLLALGRPVRLPAWAGPLPAALIFAVLLWVWHAPGPYDATFASAAVYWTMHLSLIASAVWLWSGLLARAPGGAAIAAAALSMIQMGLLGALITFAPQPLFAPHLVTTGAWGLSPLGDQQLGGALMWAPGGLAFLAVAAWIGWRLLAAREAAPPTGRLAPSL